LILNKLKNKEFIYTFLFQFTSLVGGIVLIKLLAVYLPKEDYGYYSLINSIIAFVLMMPFTALLQGVNRYVSIYNQRNEFKEFLSSVLILFVTILLIYLIIFLIVYVLYSHIFFNWKDLIFYIIILSISSVFKAFFNSINNAKRDRKNIFYAVCAEFSIKIIGIVILLHYLNIKYVLLVFIIAQFLSIVIMYAKNKQYIEFRFTKKSKIYILRVFYFAMPLIVWAIFGWFRDMSNRWYLDYFLTKNEVALFAMINSIAIITPTALQGLIGGFFIPILYEKENQEKGYTKKFLLKLLPVLLVLFLVSFVIVYFFKEQIILIIADKKYLEISWMLPWMFLIYSFYVIAMISTYEIFAHKQTKKLLIPTIIPGIVSIIGGYFLIKFYGINGALYNFTITYLIYSFMVFYVVIKYWRNK